MTSSSDILLDKLSRFAAYLRKQGMKVGLGEIQDAARALNMTGFEDRETVRAVLRALYAKSAREQKVFDQCFDAFFVSEEEFQRAEEAEREASRLLEEQRRQEKRDGQDR